MFVAALVVILIVISILAAIISILAPPTSNVSRFVAWYCLAAAAAIHFVSGVLPLR